MTEPYRLLDGSPPAVGAEPADAAARAADAAARAAGVSIREITDIRGFESVCRLFDEIWRPDPQNPPVTAELLRALTKADNYLAGAFDGDELVGACVGFFGPPSVATMHSHIAGVAPSVMRRSVGFAIKLHQRAWAMRRDVATISWTYDPLVSRNAYFNLVKLGALPAEYLANFYGGMNDGINGSDDSDRLLVSWELAAPAVAAACAGTPAPRDAEVELAAGAVVGLGRSDDGGPVAGTLSGGTVLVAVPRDIETLRSTDPGAAKEWRVAVREALSTLMNGGWRVAGFDKAGWYVLTRAGEETS
ncbi:MAG TPA: GNAT family N-acetyltransferase [Micromonosporaceae bacterium]|nr:GNAT family N-acetyltransferase [Micromonosporaceae bacterium]